MIQKEQSLPVEVQPFTVVDEYTTFSAEYTFKGNDDVHFHFFAPPEVKMWQPQDRNLYWNVDFPRALDAIARAHFGFEYPRLQASLIRDVLRNGQSETEMPEDSWWMIAQQLQVPDPNALIMAFFEKLDQALESSMRK